MSDYIREYWEGNAQKYKDSHWASWGDSYAIDLEINAISKHILNGFKVLDVGCANGYSAFEQSKKHKISINGIDFSSSMIEFANKKKNELLIGDNIVFSEGDIRNICFKDNTFDLTYTTRVLINLKTWEEQILGIEECIRVTKPGGIIVLSEGFWEPLMKLNAIRQICNLPSLVEHDFNRYLKKQKLEEYLNKKKIAFEFDDFSSIYYLGSRFLRELVTDYKSYEGFSNPINKLFYDIELGYSGGGFGIQMACIIKKRLL